VTGMRASYVKVLVAEAVALALLYWFQFAFV
jgi:hypothetical protein